MNSEKANDGGSKIKSSGGDTDNNETPNPMFRVITSKFKGKFEEYQLLQLHHTYQISFHPFYVLV